MQIRLIEDDEPPVDVPVGESVLAIRRIPLTVERAIEGTHRRALKRQAIGGSEAEQMAAYLHAVDDDRIDYALVGWRGVAGDPACTREAKLRLPEAVKELVRKVAASATRSEPGEAAAKN